MAMIQTAGFDDLLIPRLDVLTSQKKIAEAKLDTATSKIDEFRQSMSSDQLAANPKYNRLLDLEKSAATEWDCIYEAILGFVPSSHRETSAAMIVLLDLLSEGHDSERIEKELRRLASELERCS
jgi:hypothetical protein